MTPQEYLVQKSQAAGINPLHLATIMNYESGLNPNRWGGKGGNYFGLIQFGPEERQKYGVNPYDTSFEGQTDAAINFLKDRGFDPSKMGLLDMYSTVNAGSPGHYSASDGNGTVSSHVAAMQPHTEKAQAWLNGTSGLLGTGSATPPSQAQANTITPQTSPTPSSPSPDLSSLLSSGTGAATGMGQNPLVGILSQLQAQQTQATQQSAQQQNNFNQQAQAFFQQAVAANQPRRMPGLLGS